MVNIPTEVLNSKFLVPISNLLVPPTPTIIIIIWIIRIIILGGLVREEIDRLSRIAKIVVLKELLEVLNRTLKLILKNCLLHSIIIFSLNLEVLSLHSLNFKKEAVWMWLSQYIPLVVLLKMQTVLSILPLVLM